MKQILSLMLCMIVLMPALFGCVLVDYNAPEDETKLPDEYKQFSCRTVENYAPQNIANGDGDQMLTVYTPADWTFESAAQKFNIQREGKTVGSFFPGMPQEHDENCLEHYDEVEESGVKVRVCIFKTDEKYGGFARAITFCYHDGIEERNLTFEVAYTELDEMALQTLIQLAKTTLDPMMRPPQKILILGNSFINTSKVGSALQQMMNIGGKSVVVEAVSRGYATVQSYVESGDYLERIRQGEYKMLFMCGFYQEDNVTYFNNIYDACKASGTTLFAFPAHNEKQSTINLLRERYGSKIHFVDWKGEIEMLIRTGLATEEQMCIDDAHKHSTPLAGFVGAYLIYQTIYQTPPPAITTDAIDTVTAANVLQGYIKIGEVIPKKEPGYYRISNFE